MRAFVSIECPVSDTELMDVKELGGWITKRSPMGYSNHISGHSNTVPPLGNWNTNPLEWLEFDGPRGATEQNYRHLSNINRGWEVW
jgi:hypothetical protein